MSLSMTREDRAEIFDALARNRDASGDIVGAALARQQAADTRAVDDLLHSISTRKKYRWPGRSTS